jgi:GTP-binding protein EngB required for normal cell division
VGVSAEFIAGAADMDRAEERTAMNLPAPQAPGGLESKAASFIGECADYLTAAGYGDLADQVAAATTRRPAGPPAVAVIGETKRGKSALVNTLVGRPDLSPVAPQVATCVPVLFEYADHDHAEVWIYEEAGGDHGQSVIPGHPEELERIEDIAEYADEANNPGNHKLVQCVRVGLNSPRLAELDFTLVDTPGVGGLKSGHTELTLAQLRGSDAVIFVLDAGVAANPAELEIMTLAASTIQQVIIVVTKSDLVFEYQQVVEENRQLIAEHAPTLGRAPVIAFSSQLAQQAESLEPPDRSAILDEAGVTRLMDVLADTVGRRSHLLRLANTLRLCLHCLGSVEPAVSVQESVAIADPAVAAELREKKDGLEQLRRRREQWHTHFVKQLSGIERIHIDASLAPQLQRIAHEFVGSAAALRRGEDFDRQALLLQREALAAAEASIAGIEQAIYGELTDSIEQLGIEFGPPDLDRSGGPGATPIWQQKSGTLTLMEYYRNVLPTLGISGLVTGVAGGPIGPALLLFVVPIAAMAIFSATQSARQAAFVSGVERYVDQVLTQARAQCATMVGAARSPSVETSLNRLLDAEITKVDTSLAALDAAQQAQEDQRAEAQTVARQRAFDLRKRIRTGEALLDEVAGAAPGAESSGRPG